MPTMVSKRRPQPEGYVRETEEIKRRKPQYENKVHKFVAAEWTHPNGHPRCKLCGDEEPIGGMCNKILTEAEQQKAYEEWRNVLDPELSKRGFDPRQPRNPNTGEWIRVGSALRALARLFSGNSSSHPDTKALTPEEKELTRLAKLKSLVDLKDGKGPVEERLRRALDKLGIDPYDVSVSKLDKHASEHASAMGLNRNRAGESRFWFKSPCWTIRDVDFCVHVMLPAMMEDKYPETAKKLRGTSPRWNKAKLIRKARRGGGIPLWDGDGVQGAGQPRDRRGRWVGLPGPSSIKRIGIFELTDGTTGLYQDNDRRPRKVYKDHRAANRAVAQAIKEDAQLYKENQETTERMKKTPQVRQHARRVVAQREREQSVVAETARRGTLDSLRSLGSESEAPVSGKKKSGRVKVSPLERIENPGTPTRANYDTANKWARDNLPKSEANYAQLISRLLKNKGITQDPAKRGELSDRYGIPASRLVAIEQEMYDHLIPDRGKPKPRKRNLQGASPNTNARQEKEMLSHGALKVVPLAGDPQRPSRMFKATKGPHKGNFVETDWQGKSRALTDKTAERKIAASNKYWGQKLLADQSAQAARSRKYREQQRALYVEGERNRQAQKAAKIRIAQKWATDHGLDPDDSYWWGAFWKDPTLVVVQDGSGAPKANWVGGRTSGTRRAPTKAEVDELLEDKTPTRRVRRKPKAEVEEEEEIAPAPRRTVRVPKGTTGAKPVSHPRRKPAVKKPAGEKKPRTVRAPKREKLTFDTQTGLPLLPASSKPKKKYKPLQYKPSVVPKTRAATKADLKALEDRGVKVQEKHKNIRVPTVDKEGSGAFDYIFDDHEIKSGKVKPGRKAYKKSHHTEQARRKFDRIANISDHMAELDEDIRKGHKTDDTAAGLALMRILGMRPSSESGGETLVRVGTDDNGNGIYEATSTYGVTSMQRQHVSVSGNSVTISLTGKSAHEIKIKTDDPVVVGAITAALKRNKGKPTDRLFPNTTEKETIALIKKHMPDAKNKDMRTYVATSMAIQIVAQMPKPTSVAEFKNQLLDVVETTANQLQHGPTQSRDSYVSPSVFMEWALTVGLDYELFERTKPRQMRPLGWEENQPKTRRRAKKK